MLSSRRREDSPLWPTARWLRGRARSQPHRCRCSSRHLPKQIGHVAPGAVTQRCKSRARTHSTTGGCKPKSLRDGYNLYSSGDSRQNQLYLRMSVIASSTWFVQARPTQLTRDHSYVGRLVESGLISRDEAEFHPQRHILTAALGTIGDLVTDSPEAPLSLQPGDTLILCTDGLWGQVRDEELAEHRAGTRHGSL